jgi:Zinc finger, C3HC4 type (RING finger)
MKGETFVKEVLSRFENGDPWKPKAETSAQQEPEEDKEETAAVEPTPGPKTTSQEETARKDESSSLKEALLCKICFDQQMSMVFLPCGHSLSCPSCATALSSCPLCRKEIQATVRAFFSFSC